MATRNGRRAERRRTTRADARLSMRLEAALQETESAQVVTESQNISASGVYCMSPHYLAPLSKVALTIVLPKVPGGRANKELVKVEGIVVRCDQSVRRGERPYQLACMFSELDDEMRSRIEAFVTWRNLQALRAAARSVSSTARARAGASPKARASAATPPRTAVTPRRTAVTPRRTAPTLRRTTATPRRTVH